MAIVGSAQVRISALEGLRPTIKAAGKKAGDDFGKEFQSSIARSFSGMQRQFQQMGRDAGRSYASGFTEGVSGNIGSGLQRAMAGAEREMSQSGRRSSDNWSANFQPDVDNKMRRVSASAPALFRRSGSDSGRAFSTSFGGTLSNVLSNSLAKSSKAAADNFTKLWSGGVVAGTAITQLVGAISSLVSGLYLVVTAAASAASSLVAVAGVFGSLLQGGIALGIAFRGIGEAIGAGFEGGAKSAQKSSASTIAAARRVADARKRIADVQIRNAERIADANERVEDAERDLRSAQRDAESAQRSLTAARREAQEELQQLAFSAEDAALAEERAAMRLEEAYEELQAVQGRPVDDRQRREAELAFKEADLGYRRSKDRASDLAEEQERAAKTGIEGTRAYSSALEDVQSANQRVFEAEEKLADARSDRGKAEAQNARDLADAQEALTRALEDQANAAQSATAAVDKYAEALAKLSPAAQSFVQQLVAMKPRFEEFTKAIQEAFFSNFNGTFFSTLPVLLNAIQGPMEKTAEIMGLLGSQLFQAFADNADLVTNALDGGNRILSIFTREGENGYNMMEGLVTIFLRLWEAIEPVTTRFAEWLSVLVDGAAATLDTEEGLGRLTEFFDRAGDRAAAFGEIFGHVFDLFGSLAEAAAPAIDELLSYFNESFEGMATSAENNMGGLTSYFNDVVENIKPILDLVGQLGMVFLELGASPAIKETFEILRDGTGDSRGIAVSIREILLGFSEAGPEFARLIVAVGEIVALLTESGAFTAFFDQLADIAEAVRDFLQQNWVQDLMADVGPWIGRLKAIGLLFLGLPLVGKVLFGYFAKMGGLVAGIGRTLGTAGRAVRGAVTGARAASGAGALGRTAAAGRGAASSVRADALAKRRNAQALSQMTKQQKVMSAFRSIGAKVSKVFRGVGKVFSGIGKALAPVTKLFSGIGRVFGTLFNVLKPVLSIFGRVFSILIRFAGPIGIVIGIVMTLIQVFKWAYENVDWFREAVDKVIQWFKNLPQMIGEWVNNIKEFFSGAWDDLSAKFQENVDRVGEIWNTFREWVMGIPAAIGEWLGGMWDTIWQALQNAWNFVLELYVGYWEFIFSIPGRIWEALQTMWDIISDALQWVWDRAVVIFQAIWDFVIGLPGRIWDGLQNMWDIITDALGWVWDRALLGFQRMWDYVAAIPGRIWEGLQSMWSGISEFLGNAIDGAKQLWNDFIEWVKDVPGKIADAFKNLGNLIGEKIVGGLNDLIDWINESLIGGLERLIHGLAPGIDLPRVPNVSWTGMAEGGYVSGPGGPKDDKIPARLSNGEYVMRHEAVRRIGRGNLDKLNKGGLDIGSGGQINIGNWRWDTPDVVGAARNWGLDRLGEGLVNLIDWTMDRVPAGFKNANFFTQLLFGAIETKLKEAAEAFGRDKQKEADAAAATNAGSNLPPYTGPPGAWTFPLGVRAGWNTYPGHSYGGIDFPVPTGVAIRAASSGVIGRKLSLTGSYGKYIVINHGGVETVYAHMSRFAGPSVGQNVKTGQVIGYVGSTGNSTGPHLHFEVRYEGNAASSLRRRGVALAKGGMVRATPGGVMSLLAEGGKHERVEPLDSQGLSARDKALISEMAAKFGGGAGGGGTVVRVYIGDRELSDLVRYEVDDSNQRLARSLAVGRRGR